MRRALPVWAPRAALSPGRLAAAMRELAECTQVTEGPLGRAVRTLRSCSNEGGGGDHPDGAQLAKALDRLTTVFGDLVLRYGSWHGDWTPWNMAVLEDTLLVWDWSGSAPGYRSVSTPSTTPCKAVHRWRPIPPKPWPPPSARCPICWRLRRRRGGAGTHRPAGTWPAAARYLADRQAEAGARLGALGTWLLPGLLGRLDHLGEPARHRG